MSITAAQLIWRKSQEMSNVATNGGLMSAIQAVDGVKNNTWPDVPQAERDAGSTKYRKIHIHNNNEEGGEGLSLFVPRIFIETYTPGDDFIYLVFTDDTEDQQGDLTGSEEVHGAGHLNADASINDSYIDVMVEAVADEPFGLATDGRLIRISSESRVGEGDGDTQFIRLHTTGGVADQGGGVVRLTFEAGATLDYNFSLGLANTRVASVVEASDIMASYDTVNQTGGGTFTETDNLLVNNIGSVEDFWTCEFTDDSGNFKISGVNNPSELTGFNYSSNASPMNSDFSKPYFTINSAAWNGGTGWLTGDTVTFYTRPGAVPVWYKRIIPAGANSLSGNSIIVGITGESE